MYENVKYAAQKNLSAKKLKGRDTVDMQRNVKKKKKHISFDLK